MRKRPCFEDKNARFYFGDCLKLLELLPDESIDLIFADPPYNLSNGGITCKAGKMVSVDKGNWDKSKGFEQDFEFTSAWIAACKRVLKPDGSIWISGTPHNIFSVGFALQSQGYKILNEVCWYKPNAPPNLACRYFAHAHESVIWARKSLRARHKFHYRLMKEMNDGRQMRSLWTIPLTPASEKLFGKHPTQKPIELLYRIIASTSDEGDFVLDPFLGSGTTAVVAKMLKRNVIGFDIERDFLRLAAKRYEATAPGPITITSRKRQSAQSRSGSRNQQVLDFMNELERLKGA
jgi:site-specific DNA-methyltransferase (adenine-specific)